MRIEFLPAAEEDIVEATARYEMASPGLAERFRVEIRRTCLLLLEHPMIGRSTIDGLRQFTIRTFPYTLVYSVMPDIIMIVSVVNQHREPGYWRNR